MEVDFGMAVGGEKRVLKVFITKNVIRRTNHGKEASKEVKETRKEASS